MIAVLYFAPAHVFSSQLQCGEDILDVWLFWAIGCHHFRERNARSNACSCVVCSMPVGMYDAPSSDSDDESTV